MSVLNAETSTLGAQLPASSNNFRHKLMTEAPNPYAHVTKFIHHFSNPRNVGELENPSGTGTAGNARCSDVMKMDIQVEDGVVTDVKFETFGCGAAIAGPAPWPREMVKGKRVSEALQLTNKAVAEALDGLPPVKMHCSMLAEQAIHAAVEDYIKKHPEEAAGLELTKAE